VLPLALRVGEPQVDIFDLIFFDLLQDFGRGASHGGPHLDARESPSARGLGSGSAIPAAGRGVTTAVNFSQVKN
jgi:hypothetical protein